MLNIFFLKYDLKFCIFATYIYCSDVINVPTLKRDYTLQYKDIMYEKLNNINMEDKNHGEEDPPIYNIGFANVMYRVMSSGNDEKRENLNEHICNKVRG
jgi:hypothetical protein